jgi:gamma-glutamyl-gamma-aminobutyrate hydrolase PuuD
MPENNDNPEPRIGRVVRVNNEEVARQVHERVTVQMEEMRRKKREQEFIAVYGESSKPDIKTTTNKKKRIGIGYNAFVGCFAQAFDLKAKDIDVITTWREARNYDLVILSGGEDIDPSIYNEENVAAYGVNPYRDEQESNILMYALDSPRTKILAVCRGHQLVNGRLGGKLHQDYASEGFAPHNGHHELVFANGVNENNSVIYKFFNGKTIVSCHHQAVKKIADSSFNLKPIASYQGVNEAVESSKIISVQFHPEFDIENNKPFFNFVATEW